MNETAIFGGGCFWCTEAVFQRLKGVLSVTSGYAGGKVNNPSYYDVTEGTTGHAEVVRVEFDPKIISFDQLLEVFWAVHDPTSMNRQGNDVGTQYRSIILYTNNKQKLSALNSIEKLKKSGHHSEKIVTELKELDKFYTAEDYHKNYFNKNETQPYCQFIIVPKVDKLLNMFPNLVKTQTPS